MKPSLLSLVSLAILFLLVAMGQSALAQWSTNPSLNNAICTASGGQSAFAIAGDGAGGAIITWRDERNGNQDIYAQRINAAGFVQWTSNGVAICTESHDQSLPVIVSDGAGGAIIAWHDMRALNYDIYAQRISAAGAVQWTTDGVGICTDYPANQTEPCIASDGAGGAIIAWLDARMDGNNKIFAQRINAAGAVLWGTDGAEMCWRSYDQASVTIISDGQGGAILAWMGFTATADWDVYALRINAAGTDLWTDNGMEVCAAPGQQSQPAIVSDGAGGAIITWSDWRDGINTHIFAQRINAAGAACWRSNGVGICTSPGGSQGYPSIVSDGSGGAVITWQDWRAGYGDIYAQRINADSIAQWTSNGVAICTATGSQDHPTIASSGAGGAIIAWHDTRSGFDDIYAQRISGAGTVRWASNGVAISTAPGPQTTPLVVDDGIGGAIMTWWDQRIFPAHIYAQKFDRYGYLGDATAHIAATRDVTNDQGGRIRVMWDPSYLDAWPNTTVRSYNLWMGTKTTGIVGKMGSSAADNRGTANTAQSTTAGGIYWELAGSVAARWLIGYSSVVTTYADSGLQGVPVYYFQVIAQAADSTVYWTSNVDSGYSIDNIPPVGVKGSAISSTGYGSITLVWNKDRVDPDLMGYQIYRSTSTGFLLDRTNQLAMAFDTTYTDDSPTPGQTYYYRVAGVDIHGNLGTPSDELNQIALSVNLTSFAATSSRLSAELRWMTMTETNIYGFEIERRSVGQRGTPLPAWQEVGFVAGSGTSSSPRQYGYVDRTVTAGTYDYRIKQIQTGGSYAYSSTVEVVVGLAPKEFTLSQNYPNPFNPTTTIEFTIPQDGRVRVTVYNTLGEEIATLLDQNMEAGVYHRVSFDATHQVSGVYLVRLQFGDKQLVRKLLLVK